MADAQGRAYMLDTEIFHSLARLGLEGCGLAGRRLFATHSQLAELRMLKDAQQRSDLLKAFEGVLSPEVIEPQGMTETGVLTDSQFLNTSTWIREDFALVPEPADDGGQPGYTELFDALEARGRKRYNVQDAVVVETAIKQKAVLITADGAVAALVRRWGGEVEEWMLPADGVPSGTS